MHGNIEEILERIKKALETHNQRQLAKALGVSPARINDAKNSGAVPAGWLVTLSTEYGLSQKWILTGEGPMKISPESDPQCSEAIPFATSKHIMGCKKLSTDTTGRRVLEAIIDLAENDPERFLEVAGFLMKADRESKEKREAKKNDLSRGQGESNTESEQSSASLNIGNHD